MLFKKLSDSSPCSIDYKPTCPTLGRGSTSSLEACEVFLDSNTSCLNTVARNLVTKKRDAISSSGKLRT